MRLFAELFKIDANTTVLDMGGDAFNWSMTASRPTLTILNIYDPDNKLPGATYIVGDGCDTGLPAKAFDIVFSNSVIEHVGSSEKRRKFAAECMRCGKSFFVQTPNRWFPFDTHTLMPLIHWLPQRVFSKLVPISPRFLFFKADPGDFEDLKNLHLLTKKELQDLFPTATIIEEKFLGITKSLIAISAVPGRSAHGGTVRADSGKL